MGVLREIGQKFAIAGEMFSFLWARKMWWLAPFVFVLLFLGILIAIGSATGVGPFIYTLF